MNRTNKIGIWVFAILLSLPLANPVYAAPDKVVLEVQQKLHSMGYDPGPADGFWGMKTKTAIGRYQVKNKLPPTKPLDQTTLDKLGVKRKASFRDRGLSDKGKGGNSICMDRFTIVPCK